MDRNDKQRQLTDILIGIAIGVILSMISFLTGR